MILDQLGFSPGVLDGRDGQSLTAALKGFQESRGLHGHRRARRADARALAATIARTTGRRGHADPAIAARALHQPDARGSGAARRKLPALGYRDPIEKLAEMFHTTPEVLIALNRRRTRLGRRTVVVPNALPTSRDYARRAASPTGARR